VKVFITGSAGTGKTTVIKTLAEKGYAAYDTDDVPGSTQLELRATGEPTNWPTGYVDWAKYSWRWQEDKIRELLASDDTVFLGAVVGNWQAFVKFFDVFIVLTVDTVILYERLTSRDVHEFGQNPQNIQLTVEHAKKKTAEFIEAGAIAIDSGRPILEVVSNILRVTDAHC